MLSTWSAQLEDDLSIKFSLHSFVTSISIREDGGSTFFFYLPCFRTTAVVEGVAVKLFFVLCRGCLLSTCTDVLPYTSHLEAYRSSSSSHSSSTVAAYAKGERHTVHQDAYQWSCSLQGLRNMFHEKKVFLLQLHVAPIREKYVKKAQNSMQEFKIYIWG